MTTELPTGVKTDAELFAQEYKTLCDKYKMQIIACNNPVLELQMIKEEEKP